MSDSDFDCTKNTTCPHCGRAVALEHCDKDRKEIELVARGNRSSVAVAGLLNALQVKERRYLNGDWPSFDLDVYLCAGCSRVSVYQLFEDDKEVLLYPNMANRGVDLSAVDPELVKDYLESVAVLQHSTNASAALSRRVLQAMLVKQGATKKWLKDQIDELADDFPSSLGPFVDKIRDLGNLAAHATAEHASAEILDVDPEEAEWLLLLIEGLFDHYYTKPAQNQARLEAVEAKIASTKKPKKELEHK